MLFKKKDSSGFRLACVKNQRENELKSKMLRFIVFRDVEISTYKKKILPVNNFDWMIVKLRMYAT